MSSTTKIITSSSNHPDQPCQAASLDGFDFLPGRLTLRPGEWADYQALQRFHYIARRPATRAAMTTITFTDRHGLRPVAVGVLSYPVPRVLPRDRYFALQGLSYGEHLRFANANLRTISRVIVHPQFRGLGLAVRLIRQLIERCPTRHVEALARMGRCHPMFELAGMTRVSAARPSEPEYFIHTKPPATLWEGEAPAEPSADQSTA